MRAKRSPPIDGLGAGTASRSEIDTDLVNHEDREHGHPHRHRLSRSAGRFWARLEAARRDTSVSRLRANCLASMAFMRRAGELGVPVYLASDVRCPDPHERRVAASTPLCLMLKGSHRQALRCAAISAIVINTDEDRRPPRSRGCNAVIVAPLLQRAAKRGLRTRGPALTTSRPACSVPD